VAEQVATFFSRTTVADLHQVPADHPVGEALVAFVKKGSRSSHGGLIRAR
jgi:hypothetical protein